MKFSHICLVVALVIAGGIGINSIGHTQTTRPSGQVQATAFSYATLTTQSTTVGNEVNYSLVWNEGQNDIIGRSGRSLLDARRRLNSQLDGRNTARTNLTTLLNTVGGNGWRLVETTQDELGSTQIFTRIRR